MTQPSTQGALSDAEQLELKKRVAEIIAPLKRDSSNVIVALQAVQGELGWLPPDAFRQIASHLRVSTSEVFGAATFYAQFYTTPRPAHMVKACSGTACHVRGGQRVLNAVKNRLNIVPGENTPDLKFGLERVACFGACALGPVLVVDEEAYGSMTPGKVELVLEEYS